jgi:hypothetical protein
MCEICDADWGKSLLIRPADLVTTELANGFFTDPIPRLVATTASQPKTQQRQS